MTNVRTERDNLFALTICAYRKPGMDENAYHQYLTDNHAPLLKELMIRNAIVEYTMQHNSSGARKVMDRIFRQMPESKVADYDALIHIVFQKPEDLISLRSDPHYKLVIMPDHDNFADQQRTTMVTGWYERHIAGGKAIEDGQTGNEENDVRHG